ncbi:MAG: rhodanese-like domain-containing protein [Rhodocyclaceae bacterium]|nr:rhodanese-like domain-containing protein [Rhodocyclaceae bacterium]
MKRLSGFTALLTLCSAASLSFAQVAAGIDIKGGPMHPLCKNCHQSDTNMMRGQLDGFAPPSQTIMMDLGTHKEVVKYDDDTAVKNIKEMEELKLHRGKGFRINYVEEKGEKKAVLVTRFDILQTIQSGDKLSRDEFKKFLADNKNVLVLDSRPPEPYQEAHIPGSKLLPAPAFDKMHAQVLPQDKSTPIVFYCVGGCLSPTNFMRTKAMGYTNVKVYTGGFPDWMQAEYATTTPAWLKTAIEKDFAYVLVDLRAADAVKAGHIKSAVSIPLADLDRAKDQFPKQKNAPIVLYGDGKEEAAKKLGSWGYRSVRVLPASFEDWKMAGNPVAAGDAKTAIAYVPKPRPGTVAVAEFTQLADKTPANIAILDVRSPSEAVGGKIKNAINIPLEEMPQRLAEIPKDKDIVMHCSGGMRAEMAHNLLKNSGINSRFLASAITVAKDGSFTIKE